MTHRATVAPDQALKSSAGESSTRTWSSTPSKASAAPVTPGTQVVFFNELLLDMDDYDSVIERTGQNLDWAAKRNTSLAAQAFIHLNRGLAFLRKNEHDNSCLKIADEHYRAARRKTH